MDYLLSKAKFTTHIAAGIFLTTLMPVGFPDYLNANDQNSSSPLTTGTSSGLPGKDNPPAQNKLQKKLSEAHDFSKSGVSVMIWVNEKEDPRPYKLDVDALQKLGEQEKVPLKVFGFRTPQSSGAYIVIDEYVYKKVGSKTDYNLNELSDLGKEAVRLFKQAQEHKRLAKLQKKLAERLQEIDGKIGEVDNKISQTKARMAALDREKAEIEERIVIYDDHLSGRKPLEVEESTKSTPAKGSPIVKLEHSQRGLYLYINAYDEPSEALQLADVLANSGYPVQIIGPWAEALRLAQSGLTFDGYDERFFVRVGPLKSKDLLERNEIELMRLGYFPSPRIEERDRELNIGYFGNKSLR